MVKETAESVQPMTYGKISGRADVTLNDEGNISRKLGRAIS